VAEERMPRPRRCRSTLLVALLPLAIVALTTAPAHAASLQLSPVRTIGGPGHAGLYGWGADTMPDGSILISDYWNFRVQHYAKNGTLLGTVIARDGHHQAPYDVAVDPRNGDIYVGDVDGGHTVDKYDATGRYLSSFGGCCTGAGRYVYPAYLTVNSTGRVFVSDSRDDNVTAVSPTGAELFQIGSKGSADGRFNTPRGIGVDAQDRVYVGDTNNHRIQVFDANGSFLFKFGQSSGPALTGDLRGLTVDKQHGWVYVVDAGTGYVNKYDTGGHFLLRFGGFGTGDGKFVNGGRSVTVDGDGNVWVADLADFRAEKFSPSGQFLLSVPQPPQPPPPGGFNQPGGVAVDASGNVFVTDSFNWRIERFRPDGTFLLQWGTRSILDYARGIAVDRRDGTVVVADTDQVKIKKFSPTGQALWSAAGKAFDVDVGSDGRIYVPDFQSKIVRVLSANGAQLMSWGGGFRFPRGIAVDPVDGSVWVSDSQRGDVQHFTASGALLGRIGSGQFAQAGGVAVDASRVYVSDTDANRVKVWTKAGAFLGSFGFGSSPILGPMGLDIVGNRLYVAERTGERIRELAISVS
jgi:tripartite motif-containing protein 71